MKAMAIQFEVLKTAEKWGLLGDYHALARLLHSLQKFLGFLRKSAGVFRKIGWSVTGHFILWYSLHPRQPGVTTCPPWRSDTNLSDSGARLLTSHACWGNRRTVQRVASKEPGTSGCGYRVGRS